jgi:hypothetical protein
LSGLESKGGAPVNKMEKHVTLVGALFIAYHILGLIIGIALLMILSGVSYVAGDPFVTKLLMTIGTVICTLIVILSVPGIIAGAGLLRRRPWARILALIIGAFDLLDIPLGTALGIYTFWVLLQDETIQLLKES